MRILRHNGGVNMLTTTSILQTLGVRHFDSYRSLLSNVANFWEAHAERLPSEIGPRDVVARAASLQLIRKNADGSIDILRPRPARKFTHGSSKARAVARTAKGRAAARTAMR